MPRKVETLVFSIDELRGTAREHAREWYRRDAIDDYWFDGVFEDFKQLCTILGLSLKQRPVRLYGGGTRTEACIFFSGFSSQGDGACFEGHYRYARGLRKSIRASAPHATDLHALADSLFEVQRRNFYRVEAAVRHAGRYSHEYSMAISVSRRGRGGQELRLAHEEIVIEALRELARWLYRQLQSEYDYLTSDEQVDEGLRVNGFTFTEGGSRFG